MSEAPRRVALVFPGQGSQAVGMGRAIAGAFVESRAVFERADAALGMPLSRVCFEGPEEALRLTATTQPAILATSIAVLEALRARAAGSWTTAIACAAGHSLGEYSALVAAGALGLEDAVRTVRRRGEYMQEAVPVGEGAMAALLGASLETVEALCAEAAAGEVLSPANLNAPDQTVVAGHAGAVDRMADLARARGVRKVVRLPVSAPFHCGLMQRAAERLAADLRDLRLRDASFPIVTNVEAAPVTGADALRDALLRQVTSPVRWTETVRRLREMGVRVLIEVGPGRVLTGLARRTAPELSLVSAEDPEGVERAARALADGGGGSR
ncbi:MAG: ACP S-malonyltransferase [Acidobacteriota bacterium]